MKNAAPREGSGVPHLKLSLSALHWQQDACSAPSEQHFVTL